MGQINIALDGPSGAGKSTIAKALARELSLVYIDTGALYRSIGLYLTEQGIDPADRARTAKALPGISLDFRHIGGVQHVFLNGRDVSEDIRRHEISKAASDCSAHPEVRAFLLELQREIARRENVIMDGRDIGTVVLPEANLKIFLTASAEDRARRRYEELRAKGEEIDFATVLSDIEKRDYNDSHRAAAPLRPAPDAVLVDTTGNSFEQSCALLKKMIKERLSDVL